MAASPKPLVAKSSPQLVAKSPPSPAQTGPVKLNVSKTYVIPPRPKPGRKPSVDAPQSKRKAQNREAQRAFRERRSLAVRELEAQLEAQAAQHAEEQARLQTQITQLQEQIRTGGSQAGSPLPSMAPFIGYATPTSPASGPSPMSMPMAHSPISTVTMSGSSPGNTVMMARDPSMDLLDHVLDQKLPVPPKPISHPSPGSSPGSSAQAAGYAGTRKFPRSPHGASPMPPPTQGLELANTDWWRPAVPLRRRQGSLETDFTYKFRRKSQTLELSRRKSVRFDLAAPPTPSSRCGFCSDDTPCICAEAAARESANMADVETLGSPADLPALTGPSSPASSPRATMTLVKSSTQHASSPSSSPSSLAPPAPLVYSQGNVKPLNNGATGCTGNPGTCDQCQQDPMSTLFCATLASRPPMGMAGSGGTFIPAQAAYQTLSRHPNFSRLEFDVLVNSLVTRGTQVEVNSVAKMLRVMD